MSTAVSQATAAHVADAETSVLGDKCKICDGSVLRVVAHTAECLGCGALLSYPYVDEGTLRKRLAPKPPGYFERWYALAGERNHDNFTAMARFALEGVPTMARLAVLDYGGGGGQFAFVLRSLYPNTDVWITDVAADSLLPQWSSLNASIRFSDFPEDTRTFDVIFLNDVFEHVLDPIATLQLLETKLRPGGRVFIDTPRPSWLYPLLRVVAPRLHEKLLRNTVDLDHQQLWTRPALAIAARRAHMTIVRYTEVAEFTREPDFYMKGMGAETNPLLRLGGALFCRFAGRLQAHNKIMAVLERSRRPEQAG